MSVITRFPKISAVRPRVWRWPSLAWWQWGKLVGALLPLLCLVTDVRHPLAWAVALHLFCDFTAQSAATTQGKAHREWRVLVYHGLIAGGWPGLLVGGLSGLLIGAVTHSLIDAANKFGFDDWRGPVLDQLSHVLLIVLLHFSAYWPTPW